MVSWQTEPGPAWEMLGEISTVFWRADGAKSQSSILENTGDRDAGFKLYLSLVLLGPPPPHLRKRRQQRVTGGICPVMSVSCYHVNKLQTAR